MKKLVLTIMILLMPVVCFGGDATFRVTWDDVNVESYEVNMSEEPGGPYEVVADGLTEVTYSYTVIIPDGESKTLYFVVVTVDDQGLKGFPSNEVSGTARLIRPPSTTVQSIEVEVRL